MTGPDGKTAVDIISRLHTERDDLRSEIAVFLSARPLPYPPKVKHDPKTGEYLIRHRKLVTIPDGIVSAAERFFSDLLDAHERGYGEPSPDWEAIALFKGRIAEVLEPILFEGKTRLIFGGQPVAPNPWPICGPFSDQQVIASGTVYPPDSQIEFIPVFEIAFKESGDGGGPLGGRVVIDLANALYEEVRKAITD